jgi:hypothetical protein
MRFPSGARKGPHRPLTATSSSVCSACCTDRLASRSVWRWRERRCVRRVPRGWRGRRAPWSATRRPAGPGGSGPIDDVRGLLRLVRKHPATCARCGRIRPLIGADSAGTTICGPCAGQPDRDYTCPHCGESGFAQNVGRCLRCEPGARVHELLSNTASTARSGSL